MATQPLFTVVIRDGKGKEASFSAHSEKLDDADFVDGSTYESMGDNLLQDLEPLIDGEIVEAYWKIPIGLDFTPQTAAANCDVEEGAHFSWRTVNGFITKFRIPTFKESLLIAGTALVDLTASAVQDWVNTIIDGPDAKAGVPEDRFNMTDNRGEDIVAVEAAWESFRTNKPPIS